MTTALNSWQAVQAEVLRRINEREWKPGDFIPNEADLSREFGCARATVNRALRGLAETGLLDRRRRAGTRVALHPVRKATLDIPVIRREIERKRLRYDYALLEREVSAPPLEIAARLGVSTGLPMLHLAALHLADGRPYVAEDRWINLQAVPQAEKVDFSAVSANEWLVANVPFAGGDIAFTAVSATPDDAARLDCAVSAGLFVMDRSTWSSGQDITTVRLTFAPGYKMQTQL